MHALVLTPAGGEIEAILISRVTKEVTMYITFPLASSQTDNFNTKTSLDLSNLLWQQIKRAILEHVVSGLQHKLWSYTSWLERTKKASR